MTQHALLPPIPIFDVEEEPAGTSNVPVISSNHHVEHAFSPKS